jgi:predicted O-linked N-acetylglucosamine transferase (SPINDLY family)
MHFGCNPLSHGELRARLQQACEQSALFDGRRYAQDFAALLERMVERQNLGLPPAPLAAP